MSGVSSGTELSGSTIESRVLMNMCSHLLVTRPSKSVALECFVVERAEQSTHIAMLVRSVMESDCFSYGSVLFRPFGSCKRR